MQGLLTFASLVGNGWLTGPAVVGILLALFALVLVREIAPYECPSTNLLANIAYLQLLTTYLVAYALQTELEDAPQRKTLLWGVILLLVNLITVLLAVWLQVTEANRRAVLQLMLLEREIREAELILDSNSFRADVERFQRITGMKLSMPTLSELLPDVDDSAAAKLQGAVSAAQCV